MASSSLDPVFNAMHKLKQHKYDDCIALCTELLAANPYDQAVWYLKCRALTLLAWVDDTDFEEEGVADVLLDENATAALPRPGTSLSRPMTGQGGLGVPGQGMRPVSASGRPLSGYARPGTGSARPDSQGGLQGAMQGARPGTSRPVTALGRLVRLGTRRCSLTLPLNLTLTLTRILTLALSLTRIRLHTDTQARRRCSPRRAAHSSVWSVWT